VSASDLAISEMPAHAQAVPERHSILPLAVCGGPEGWLMPVATWHAPTGFDATAQPDNYDHHTLTVQLDRALVQRVTEAGRVVESRGDAARQIVIQPAEADHRFHAPDGIRFAHIYFRQGWISAVATELFGLDAQRTELFATERTFRDDVAVRREATGYLARAFQDDHRSRLEMDARATLLGASLLRRLSVLADQPGHTRHRKGGLAPWQVRRVCDYIDADLHADPGLSELASLIGLSTEHFCRAFKASTGMPPHAWLVARRIECARQLLERTTLPVEEIAARVGYAEPSHLARMFRRAHGLSPTQYRRELRS
jgi:AraC family transcriptional regulator